MANDDDQRKAAIERLQNRRGFWPHLVSYLVVNGALVLIWWMTGAGYFWPVWVIAFWGVGLVMHGWTAFVQKPITEEDIKREIDRGGPAVI